MIWVLLISCLISAAVGFFMGSLLKSYSMKDRMIRQHFEQKRSRDET